MNPQRNDRRDRSIAGPRSWALALPLLLAGCASDGQQMATETEVGPGTTATQPAVADASYFEAEHDGRIYVVGSERSLADFQATHHLAYTRTLLGYGPAGKTVVFEIDPKNDALGQRLQQAFDQRHRYYVEEPRDGRIYVIGTRALHADFAASGHLPYTATLIRKGPARETLVFQIDPKDPRLVERLKREFSKRHGIAL